MGIACQGKQDEQFLLPFPSSSVHPICAYSFMKRLCFDIPYAGVAIKTRAKWQLTRMGNGGGTHLSNVIRTPSQLPYVDARLDPCSKWLPVRRSGNRFAKPIRGGVSFSALARKTPVPFPAARVCMGAPVHHPRAADCLHTVHERPHGQAGNSSGD